MNEKKCILYERDCINCGECDMCELDPQKRCDNCMKCVHTGADYNAVIVERVINDERPEKAHTGVRRKKRTNV